MKNFKYKEVHVFAHFNLCVFTDIKDWNLAMENSKEFDFVVNQEEYRGGLTCVFNNDGLVLNTYLIKDCDETTILHESIHAVDFLMENIGIEHTEFRAYTVPYLIENIKKVLREDKK